MKHFGDITKLRGYELPHVDVITGGSPCQDLSIAGKRKGLSGERSGLFMDQIRIIKEMRNESIEKLQRGRTDFNFRDIKPRFMVWENVPGAFSSNGGKDFQAVLEETAKVVERNASIPGPPEGKWPHSGCIMGDGWSIAWRLHDAQFWGVPQRRKRIALVADFAGGGAPEILFERKSMFGNSKESESQEKNSSDSIRNCAEKTSWVIGFNRERCGAISMNDAIPTLQAAAGESGNNKPMAAISFQERSGKPGGGKGILIQNERTGALSTLNNQSVMYDQKSIVYGICSKDSNSMKSENPNSGIYVADKTRTLDINCGNPACNRGGMAVVSENEILTSSKASFFLQTHNDEMAETLVATYYKDPQIVCKKNESDFQNPIVRRLTPLECERLQGFPDDWTNIGDWEDSKGKIHKGESESPRYKALGNSIAIPFWQWMAEKMIPFLGEEATMASLFDGIGGFPLAFSRVGIKPVWASEIEEFPIAVTKRRFPDEE